MGKLVLTYWPLRGLCQPIMWMLEYAGMDYELRLMTDYQEWLKEKASIPLDYPNLPHILDGDIRMSESAAISKYLAKKCNLMPETDEEIRNADMTEGALTDFKMLFFRLMFNENYDTEKEEFPAKFKAKLTFFEKILAKQPWLVGNKMTWLDFILYETLDVNSMFVPGLLDDFPKAQAFKSKIDSMDKIAAYRESGRFKAWPVTGGPARWGQKPGETIHN